MIESKPIAKAICSSGENLIATLSQALIDASATSSPETFDEFKRAVGLVIGTLDFEILAPLYKEHPDLEPDSLRGE